ncbi:MAG: DUF2294 domain-containing protein [Caldilinea sp. CFX5]|nr:DUF2294 domain-containing protein [Caldilinea sp. CFX5]
MEPKTRGMVEAEFTKAFIQFEREYLGRGPQDVRTIFLNDMVLVRLQGLMTPAEHKLAESDQGRELLKEMRRRLFEGARPAIEEMTRMIIDCKVISLHTDMSTKTGERIVVLVVDANLDEKFPSTKRKR